MTHRFQHLEHRRLLKRRQADPAVKQLLHIRSQFDHIGIRKELRHRDAKPFAYRLKRCNRRNGISSENIADRRLRQAALLRKLMLCPSALPQQLPEASMRIHLATTILPPN